MNWFIAIVLMYLTIGIVRVLYDFSRRDVFSASYVRRPSAFMTVLIILLWLLTVVARFNEQRRRIDWSYFKNHYLGSLIGYICVFAFGVWLLEIIFSSELNAFFKYFSTIGILVLSGLIIGLLYARAKRRQW